MLTFLLNPTGKEIEEFMKSDGEIKEAMNVLYKISGDKESIRLAEMREKAMMDEQSRLKGAREEGLKEGKADLLIKQLIKKFKVLPDEYKNKLSTLPDKTLEQIGIDIFEIESIEDLRKYF